MNAVDRTHYDRDRLIRLFELPIPTKSESNQREHWAARARRAKWQRNTVRMLLWVALQDDRRSTTPLTITLTRIAPRRLDTDNLASAMKATRDGVADALGHRDDSDPRLTWAYAQRRGGKAAYAVEVRLEATS